MLRLRRARGAMLKELERALLRKHGLTPTDYEALFALDASPDPVRRIDSPTACS